MQIPLVMTIIGNDRTGLVRSLAGIVAAHGGNWLESRMCRLGGQFAGILRIHVPAENQAALTSALNALQSQGLNVVVHADPAPAEAGAGEGKITALTLLGHDRPGIVRDITSALARHGVNVEELVSECVSAPMTGETLFQARVRVRLPEHCRVAVLREELENIAADLMVDVSFAELDEQEVGS